MKKNIVLIVDNDFFGQSYNTWKSVNIDLFSRYLKEENFKVEVIQLKNILPPFKEIKNRTIIYTGSVDPVIHTYTKDIIWYLHKKNQIIPSYEHLLCLENKGFQEVYKTANGIDDGIGAAEYYKCLLDVDVNNICYPVVFKKIDGAGSKYVSLIKNKSDLRKSYIKMIGVLKYFRYYLLVFRKYFLVKKTDFIEYKKYHYPKMCFILQRFIPNLTFDFKALVFNDKVYLLKRHIRPDDFRASGSGDFKFIEDNVNTDLLDYIYNSYKSLNCPAISLDVAQNNNNFTLIEFQFLHFGPYTLQKSSGFFQRLDNKWV